MKDTDKKFACPRKECGKSFNSPAALNMHKLRTHGKLRGSPTAARERNRRKLGRPLGSKNKAASFTNGAAPLAFADMMGRYTRAAEIAAAVAFLQQFGTVNFKEQV